MSNFSNLEYWWLIHWPYNSITVTSLRARWRLKSPAYRLFTQPFVQAQIKENIKASRPWTLWGEFTDDWWIPHTKGPVTRKRFPFDDVITWFDPPIQGGCLLTTPNFNLLIARDLNPFSWLLAHGYPGYVVIFDHITSFGLRIRKWSTSVPSWILESGTTYNIRSHYYEASHCFSHMTSIILPHK